MFGAVPASTSPNAVRLTFSSAQTPPRALGSWNTVIGLSPRPSAAASCAKVSRSTHSPFVSYSRADRATIARTSSVTPR